MGALVCVSDWVQREGHLEDLVQVVLGLPGQCPRRRTRLLPDLAEFGAHRRVR